MFGRRSNLVAMAKERLEKRPDRYINRIYGESEVGGTSWLYLTGRPTQEIALLDLPDNAPPELTEAIQHGIFKYGIIPVAFYGLLAGIMWRNHRPHGTPTPPSKGQPASASAREPEGGRK